MTPEQKAFLDKIIAPTDRASFNEFVGRENIALRLANFEKDMLRAWSEFVQARSAATRGAGPSRAASAAAANPAYSKLQFPEFDQDMPRPGTKRAAAAPAAVVEQKAAVTAAAPGACPPCRIDGLGARSIPIQPASSASLLPVPQVKQPAIVPEKPVTPPAPPPRPTIRLSIKNARQGEPFDETITVEPDAGKVQLLSVKFPDELGLTMDAAHWRLTGSPALSGDLSLEVRYRYMDDPEGVVRTAPLALIVNPDPKSLWKDEPSNREEPFWKEDNVHASAQGSDARIVAARRRGRSHAHKGTCCDDEFVIHVDTARGWHLAIVADGAGSAKFSRRGSQLATTTAADFLRDAFEGADGEALAKAMETYAKSCEAGGRPADDSTEAQTLRNRLFVTIGYAAHAAVKALANEAATRSDIVSTVKDLSTTLLIGLARKVGSRWVCAAYWVGDGVVGLYRKGSEVILLGDPDSGEYSGQTRFLAPEEVTQEALVRRLRFTCVEDFTAMALMTDGVSDPKFPSEIRLGKLDEWDALWQEMDAAAQFGKLDDEVETRLLEWLNFWATGEYDDRTIAIIY